VERGRNAAAALGAIACFFLGRSAGVVTMLIRVNPTESNQIEADEGWPQKGARGAKKEWVKVETAWSAGGDSGRIQVNPGESDLIKPK
jgi:hypothetical protein